MKKASGGFLGFAVFIAAKSKGRKENEMKQCQFLRTMGTCTVLAVVVLAGLLVSSRSGQAFQNEGKDDESRIQQGFAISPVPLNLEEKNRELVGLGSYIVNAQVDCNGCHTSAPIPPLAWVPGGVPYFGQRPTKVNPQYYLGGGQHFVLAPGLPDIISRNLTPDKSGLPEGGHTFEEFVQIMRTGVDFDHLHPTCSATITTNCLPPPFDGSLLQIMPWPTFQNMTDHDLRAIYEYLSSIPCIAGPPAPDPLHNDCS